MKLPGLLERWFRKPPEVPRLPRPDASPVVSGPPSDDPVDQFAAAVAEQLGLASTALRRSGASAYLDATLGGNTLRLGCNGARVWITVPLWPSLSSYRAGISWAPQDSYLRAKLTEERITLGLTNNPAFDNLYLIGGEDACALAANLPFAAQRLLVEHADIILALRDGHFDAPHPARSHEPQLRADLILHTPEGDRPGGVRLGEQLFTPAYAAACLRRIAALVAALEPLEPQPSGPAV